MSPYRSCLHCRVFAPAAPRRAWIRVSESISGLLLPQPVRMTGTPVRYTGVYLIRRRPIQRRLLFKPKLKFQVSWPIRYYPQFPGVIPDLWVDCPRVTEQSAEGLTPHDSHGLIGHR